MTDSKKDDQRKADRREARREERREDEREVLNEDQAPTNPVESPTIQANYDPTGQIQQSGQPLHSTDPEEQAAYEQQRQEAIRRSQMGERLSVEERDERDRKNS